MSGEMGSSNAISKSRKTVVIIRYQAQDIKYLSKHIPELVYFLQTLRDKHEEPDNAYTDWLLLVLGSIAVHVAFAGIKHIYHAYSSTKLPAGQLSKWQFGRGEQD